MNAVPAKSPLKAAYAVLYFGLGVMLVAVLWWLVYYGQWQGAFSLLDVKFSCIAGDSMECTNFQDFIGPSSIPVYQPMLMWAGTVVTLIGLYLSRRNRAA